MGKGIRLIGRSIIWSLKFLGSVSLLYLLFSIIGGLVPVNRHYESKPSPYPVVLFTTGIHLDICIPVKTDVMDWQKTFPDMPNISSDGYISFGWGEKEFYIGVPVWDSLKAHLVLNALFVPSPSAMHVTWYDTPPVDSLGFRKIYVDQAGYKALVNQIMTTLERDSLGHAVRIDHEAYPRLVDAFYEAEPDYQVFYTCNHWINEGLQKAGIRTAWWTPFDRLILYHLD